MIASYNWKGKVILVAEDEEINYLFLDEVLCRTSATVLWAKNGVEVVDLCRNNKIDLILMDLKMPEMNGYEAMQIVKKQRKDIIVISQTAFAIKGEMQEILSLGFNGYMKKPIRVEILLNMLNLAFELPPSKITCYNTVNLNCYFVKPHNDSHSNRIENILNKHKITITSKIIEDLDLYSDIFISQIDFFVLHIPERKFKLSHIQGIRKASKLLNKKLILISDSKLPFIKGEKELFCNIDNKNFEDVFYNAILFCC